MYATREDIDLIFGPTNVDKWADVENETAGKAEHIAERVAWSLATSEAKINARLRHGPYSIPFTDGSTSSGSGGGVPIVITDITARLAGVLLYDARRITDSPEEDEDEMSIHRKEVDETLRRILGNQIKFDLDEAAVSYPQAINDE